MSDNRRRVSATCGMLAFLAFLPPVNAAAPAIPLSGERRLSFNDGWRFYKGEAPGAEKPAFDDSAWRSVRLPHDWAIEGPFDPKANPHTGALPIFGTGWYRKSFALPAGAKGKYFSIEFDGAMSNSKVWLNGHDLGGRPYGYIGFSLDLTPYLNFDGAANVIAVRLMPEDHSSRWYPGAGIYRNVWLDVTAPVYVAHWGTYVTTPKVSDEQSSVLAKITVRNRSGKAVEAIVQTSVLDPSGIMVSRNGNAVTIPAEGPHPAPMAVPTTLFVNHTKRWDIDHPNLYTLVTEVLIDHLAVDRYTTTFGIRTIGFDKDKGFSLNGRQLKLHGVCDHHDLGALGAAVNRRAIERQLQILKAAGVNALRTSHNPPAPEILEYCDRLGLLVMDEAFDMWRIHKSPNDYSKHFADWSEDDTRDMVRRDRNHPSIVLWSIGNEVPEQDHPEVAGWREARRLTGFFHEEDPTRPTTSAFSSWDKAIQNKLADEVDIPGFNYSPMHYEQILKEHPDWIIVATETDSCVSSRGVYHLPMVAYEHPRSLQISSYDIVAPEWAMCPDVEFSYQDKFPQVLGQFVWTGFDYIGEPTPFWGWQDKEANDWPSRSSYFGFIDLAGFPKDRYYLYQSQWSAKPMVHLLPHWNWEGKEGQAIPVMTYSNAEEVELFLNGKSLGKKARFSDPWEMPVNPKVSENGKFVTKYRRIWQVPFEPGVLKAVAYEHGKQVAMDEVRTAGAPARVKLAADRAIIQADGDDLSFITVRIEDQHGNLCPMADNLVHFEVTGAGTIAAVDNGNAATTEPFQADHRKAFSGMALLIVRSKPGEIGRIKIVATSEGLSKDSTELITKRPK
ncbi:MAG: beta-galactosidase GalB [Bryobacteraceae bacterium]|jgi:beta-galactosidase